MVHNRQLKARFASLHAGQSLTEYGLIMSLVALLSLGGLIDLGKNVSNLATHMIPGYQAPASSGVPPGSNGGVGASTGGGGNGGVQGNVSLSLQDYPTELTSSVQTAGVNGTTMQLSSQLKSIAQTLLASGQIPEEDANRLTALANQGLRMAALESQIEAASQKAGSNEAFLNTPIMFEGQAFLVKDAGNLIGFSTTGNPATDLTADAHYMLSTHTAQPETLAFLNLYNDAAAIPGLQNTETMAIVQKLSAEVSYLSDVASDHVNSAHLPTTTLGGLQQQTISSATAFDSHSIYRQGRRR